MSIVKMKRLKLAAVKSQREELLKELMLLGCVEITEPGEPDEELAMLLRREKAGAFERKSDYERLEWAVSLLDKYAPEKKSILTPRPEIGRDILLDSTSLEEYLALAKQLDLCDDRIKRIEAEESHARTLIETLKPWEKLDVPLEVSETGTCFLCLGTLPPTAELKAIEDDAAEAGGDCQIIEVSVDNDARYVMLVALKADKQTVMETLRKYGFGASSVSELRGTASENIAKLNKELSSYNEQKELLSDEIRAAAPGRNELKLCADRMLTKMQQAEGAEKLLYTQSAFSFEGWIPAAAEKALDEVLSKYDCAWETQEPATEDYEEVPVKLKSNALTRPMNMVTEMYSLPAYNGIDPNALLLPSFAAFFGIMFADIGYGLILLLVGLIIKLKVKPRATMGYMGGIAIITGISCMIFGAITGTFFGDIIPQVAAFFGKTGVNIPMLIDPLSDPMTVLFICIGIGVVHLLTGTIANAYMLIRDGNWKDFFCDVVTTWIVFAGLALGAMGITWYVTYAGLILIVLTQGRSSPTIFGKLGGGLWGLYNFATGWFGDILSYCRLMALMLASAVIAQVFNTLGAMTGNIIAFAVIFLIGHALNFGLNIIGTYVHTSRLEYLEFFGKFYREGGRAFEPLETKTNYYDIIKN